MLEEDDELVELELDVDEGGVLMSK